MPDTPFTHAQAKEICEDFEDLIETELVLSSVAYDVIDLVICPFPDPFREQFVHRYLNGHTEGDLPYTEDGFDVLLYVCNIATGMYSFINIRQYIAEKVFNYNFPGV
jgi:hypothetical protein